MMSLTDAEPLIAMDVRLPATLQTAAEKLYGWSIFVDLFHGDGTTLALNLRTFVPLIGPTLHALSQVHPENPRVGMDHINHVLFEAQQDYFSFVSKLANGLAMMNAAPTFQHISDKVLTYRAA